MNYKRKSAPVRLLTGALTLCVMLGAAFLGVYPVASAAHQASPTAGEPRAAADKVPGRERAGTDSGRYARLAEKSYEAGSLPLFEIAFPRLDESAQKTWLEKLYAEGDFAFFSVAVRGLDTDSSMLAAFAEKAYADEEIAFFSTLADCMDDAGLELWLGRALEDGNWAFQSMLSDKLDRDDEFDELEEKREKELEKTRAAEYQAAGVTMDGKEYFYQGQLVDVFLDIRPNNSFSTLHMNPKGTVNIKIIRDADNTITGVAYMTEAEVAELFGGMEDPDDASDTDALPVSYKTVAAGETILLGEYTLSEGDGIRYDISAKTGDRMKVFFARDEQRNTAYWSVDSLRQPGEALTCAADFTVAPPAKPGTYRLYLQAPDSALGTVTGSVSIAPSDAP